MKKQCAAAINYSLGPVGGDPVTLLAPLGGWRRATEASGPIVVAAASPDAWRTTEPHPNDALALATLAHWDADDRSAFWCDPTSPARRLVKRAFSGVTLPMDAWLDGFTGELPGDGSGTVVVRAEAHELRVGIVVLNTVFRMAPDTRAPGELSARQFAIATGGDPSRFAASHDLLVLVTYSSVADLSPESRRVYEAVINPNGRFALHVHRANAGQAQATVAGLTVFASVPGSETAASRGESPRVEVARGIHDRTVRIVVTPPSPTPVPMVLQRASLRSLAGDAPWTGDGGDSGVEDWPVARVQLAKACNRQLDICDLAWQLGLPGPWPLARGPAVDLWEAVLQAAARQKRMPALLRAAERRWGSDGTSAVRRKPDMPTPQSVARMLAPWPANMQHAAVRAARLAAVPDSGADEGDTRASEIVRAILANHGILGIHRLHRAMERLEMDRGRTSAAVPDEKSLYFLIEHMLPSTALLASFGADVPAFHRAVRAGTPRAGLADLLVRSAPPGELLAKLRDWSPRAFAELEGRVKYRSPEGKGTKVPEASLRTRLRQK